MAIPNRNINYPTAIKYGAGRIKELAEFCKANGIARPLVVTDKGLAAMPMVADIMADLHLLGGEIHPRRRDAGHGGKAVFQLGDAAGAAHAGHGKARNGKSSATGGQGGWAVHASTSSSRFTSRPLRMVSRTCQRPAGSAVVETSRPFPSGAKASGISAARPSG